MATSKRILISGAGIAGPSVALLLTRMGHKCTIVERSSSLRIFGQQIDISGAGLEVVQFMGIEQAIRDRTVEDQGVKFVDGNDRTIGAFPAQNDYLSLVKEIEIMRGDVAQVLYDATKAHVEYILGDFLTALDEREHCITVSFDKSPDRDFDLVIGADGLNSKTRRIAFGSSGTEIKSLHQCTALLSIPWADSDGTWSRWSNTTGGRVMLLRPHKAKRLTGAYLIILTADSGKLAKLPTNEQKKAFAETFRDAGWESERIIGEVESSEDFYVQETAQVRTPSWVKGRVALVGDAGYCPSPVTGQGTTLAIVGAYILAGCIATYDDVHLALRKYEEHVRPFVDSSQKLYPGVPWVACPQTAWGITVLRTFIWLCGFVVRSGTAEALSWVANQISKLTNSTGRELPKYPALSRASEKA